ncbi:conserved hypothetical protein [Trichophyton verrucosum HKI 0517]|uniref:Uncharacterized protein n=1 Tax=Trichophyton verrucosum (strain HKI 0517) TaxID=663202 RepID=D4D1Z5_TRIVH|nr:uncharacterized protein TRV_01097 [Trichophyton verrucosum HKI 0517]EFE44137.1 conserved hypothetical protein [Trichophyton verrucosum HKI 0517]
MPASRFLGLCALLQAFRATQAFAPDWTITKYFEDSVTTLPGNTGRYGTYPATEYTSTVTVVPTVTSPIATATIIATTYPEAITYILIGLEPGQGTSSSYDYSESTNTYYVPLTYTYPRYCSVTSGESTITTSARISIPTEIQSHLTPTVTSVTTSVVDYLESVSYYTSAASFIDPTELPSGVYSSIEASHTPSEIQYCPYGSHSSSGGYGSQSSSSSSSSDNYDGYCGRYYGCYHSYWSPYLALSLIITFSWFGLFFIVGLIESAVRFRKLMRGRGASRGLPKSFACLCPILSCLFIICMHRGYRPKPREEQEELERNWKSMSFAAKFTLWLKYGFSRSYPPMLGAAPPLATDPLPASQPQMAQQPVVPGVMPPLPQQTGPQPLPHQTDQQTERQADNQQQEQQPVLRSAEQNPESSQREYQPLPAVGQSGSTGLFEHPTHAVSPVNEQGSPLPLQSDLTQPYTSHNQHIHEEQPQNAITQPTDLHSGAPKNA